MSNPVAATATAITIPSFMACLSVGPSTLSEERLDWVWDRISPLQERAEASLGQWAWSLGSEIVLTSCWISIFALFLLLEIIEGPLDLPLQITFIAFFINFAFYTFSIPKLLTQNFSLTEEHSQTEETSPLAEDSGSLGIVSRARDISDFDTIPECFLDDQVLNQCRCPISRKPIRYIVVASQSLHTGCPVWYERDAVERWIQNESSPPRAWPDGAPLEETSLEACSEVQYLIDTRLRQLLARSRRESDQIYI